MSDQPVKEQGVPSILRRVMANTGKLLGGKAVNAILGLAYVALAARGLGASELGVVILIHAFAQFFGDVVKFQSWQTIIHYGARPLAEGRKAEVQQVLRFTLALDAVSTVVGVALGAIGAVLFAGVLGWTADDAPAAALYMVTVAMMVSATPMGLLRLFDRFDVLAGQTALVSVFRLIGVAIAWALKAPFEGYLLAWAFGTLGGYVYMVIACFGELRRQDLLAGFKLVGPLSKGLPGVWKFAWNTNVATTLDVAFTHVVTLLIGGMIGPAQAAYWRIGRQVANAIAKPAKLLTPALYPELSRLYAAERHDDMWKLAKQVGLLAGGAGTVLLAVSAFGGPWLLSTVMGKSFAAAADVMTWQVGAAVIAVFALPLEPMLISLGKPGAAVRARLVVGVAFIVALPFLVSAFGLTGAGAGLVAAAGALALVMLWSILRESRNRPSGSAPPSSEDAIGLKGEA
jgi:O-antigen/teichoic acid export membrane protein